MRDAGEDPVGVHLGEERDAAALGGVDIGRPREVGYLPMAEIEQGGGAASVPASPSRIVTLRPPGSVRAVDEDARDVVLEPIEERLADARGLHDDSSIRPGETSRS